MILAMLMGAAVGAGVLLLVYVLSRPVPGIGATLSRIDAGRRTTRAATASAAGSGADGRLEQIRESVGERIESEVAARAVVVLVCMHGRAPRGAAQHVADGLRVSPARVVVVPPDAGLQAGKPFDPTQVSAETRAAMLAVTALVASSGPGR